jgi:hypothetical protein
MNNRRTLVSVHGYNGDAGQVKNLLPYYLHHGCPVVIMSPIDSPITSADLNNHQGLIYRFSGQRAYIGDLSMERQKQHMKVLLEFKYDWYLMNDSDSFVLSPKLPESWFEPDVFWSHEASDTCHTRPADWPYWRLAFQPPYFCSRRTLEQMVAATALVTYESIDMKFIDHYLMRLAHAGKIGHRTFPRGCSCPTNHAEGKMHMTDQINHGGVTLHSIKTQEAIDLALDAYRKKTRA